jgi:hypothetical protein
MRKLFSSAAAAILLLTTSAEAHHPKTLGALRMAIQIRNFRQMKALFSADAYEGKNGSIALKSLEKWIEEAENVRFEHGADGNMPALSKIRVAMDIYFSHSKANPDRARWVYILCDKQEKPVNVTSKYGKHNDCKWRIARLTTSEKEAVKFFGKSMDHLYKRGK